MFFVYHCLFKVDTILQKPSDRDADGKIARMSFHVGIDPWNGFAAVYNEKNKEAQNFKIELGKISKVLPNHFNRFYSDEK